MSVVARAQQEQSSRRGLLVGLSAGLLGSAAALQAPNDAEAIEIPFQKSIGENGVLVGCVSLPQKKMANASCCRPPDTH